MKPEYREDRATQAAAKFLEWHGGTMSHMKLIKLLYLADRESLKRHGRPITFDWYASLSHGPILSRTLELISEGEPPGRTSYWYSFISPSENYNVTLRAECPEDELSDAEIEVLGSIYDSFGELDKWELVKWLHDNLSEWKDPEGSMIPIDYVDILRAVGRTEQEIAALDAELESIGMMERVVQ